MPSHDLDPVLARFLSWNLASSTQPWSELTETAVDVALVQEALVPPSGLRQMTIPGDDDVWATAGGNRSFRTAIVALADRVQLTEIPVVPIGLGGPDALEVSRGGTITAATADIDGEEEPITLVSVYAIWERPMQPGASWIYADASVHRLISDISALIATQQSHRLVVAGDLNILHGHGEHGSAYWRDRYLTVFDRMSALGLVFCGPQADYPAEGAERSAEIPADSRNVPTFRTRRNDPTTATRQLDFVFASVSIADRLTVWADNAADRWGPSDHCRIMIDFNAPASDRLVR